MVHFSLRKQPADLNDRIPVELESFGETTRDMLCERVYPVYSKAMMGADKDWPSEKEVSQQRVDEAWKQVNEALSIERQRQKDAKDPKISDDPTTAALQKTHDMPKVLAERAAIQRRRRELKDVRTPSDRLQ